ncbi:MAG: D-aminoacyl-tRNA deacylase [Desulfobacterales bacterium]
MRVVVQRVSRAGVRVGGETIAGIGAGLLVFLGVERGDTAREAGALAEKVAHLRIFEDEAGRFNRCLLETGGEALVVSQFTLAADCRSGRRPSFTRAAPPDEARALYEVFLEKLAARGVPVRSGRFQARMAVDSVNDGPVTLVIDLP